METYKQVINPTTQIIDAVQRMSDFAFIPFSTANTDYQKFKSDVLDGAELQDADGTVMPPADAVAFIETLP